MVGYILSIFYNHIRDIRLIHQINQLPGGADEWYDCGFTATDKMYRKQHDNLNIMWDKSTYSCLFNLFDGSVL